MSNPYAKLQTGYSTSSMPAHLNNSYTYSTSKHGDKGRSNYGLYPRDKRFQDKIDKEGWLQRTVPSVPRMIDPKNSRGAPRFGAVSGKTVSKVRAEFPVLPGQHTKAQEDFIMGYNGKITKKNEQILSTDKNVGQNYYSINPYTSLGKQFQYGAGGASIGRQAWRTYLPTEEQRDNEALRQMKLKSQREKQDNSAVSKSKEDALDDLAASVLDDYQPKNENDDGEPVAKKPTLGLSRLDVLQARNEQKIRELNKIELNKKQQSKIAFNARFATPEFFASKRALDPVVQQSRNGQVRKPVLYNPLAKQMKEKEAVGLYSNMTPKIVEGQSDLLNLNKQVVPPPPGRENFGHIPLPPSKENNQVLDLHGNIINADTPGFATDYVTEFKKQELTGVNLGGSMPVHIPKSEDEKEVGNSKSSTNKKGKGKNKNKKYMRGAGDEKWEDKTLEEWGDNDFRIFVGDIGQEVTDEILAKAFHRYTSFRKAKVIIDKTSRKSKGFGFVSLGDPDDYIKAMREMQGHYIGARPVKLTKSNWKNRDLGEIKKKNKMKRSWGFKVVGT